MRKRRRHHRKPETTKSFSMVEVQREAYRGGPETAIGKRFRYRAGTGIRKVGDRTSTHGPVRIIVKDGVRVETAAPETQMDLRECA